MLSNPLPEVSRRERTSDISSLAGRKKLPPPSKFAKEDFVMKTFFASLLAALIGFVPAVALADQAHKGDKGKFGKDGGQNVLACLAVGKAHFYLAHAKEIGLSDEQVNKIKSLKMDLKKKLIRDEAEAEVVKMDLMAALFTDQPDQAKINSLIDKKHEIKKNLAKASVQALLDIKGTLTAEQKEKAKELWKEGKKRGFFSGGTFCRGR